MIPTLPRSLRPAVRRPGAAAGAQNRGDPNTLRIKTFGDLRSIDPFISPEYMARNHGYMVYDTLFALDSQLRVQPQMVERWSVGEDGRVWNFTLREGLAFHDGTPVTSEDVIASLRRWAVRDGLGQQITALATAMEPVDARSFRITLRAPFGLMLQALSKPSGQPPFIMPARVPPRRPPRPSPTPPAPAPSRCGGRIGASETV